MTYILLITHEDASRKVKAQRTMADTIWANMTTGYVGSY